MTIMVKDLPDEERPREKLLTFGAQYLSNTELLAILLHSGTRRKSVLEVAQEILSTYKSDGLASIVNVPPSELTRINGLGPAKAATLLAAVELGLRIAKSRRTTDTSSKRPTMRQIMQCPACATKNVSISPFYCSTRKIR